MVLLVQLSSVLSSLYQTDSQLSYVLTFFLLFLETYSPQVLIKTRIDNAIVSKDYSLQCNSRGNPLPRLLWSKKTDRNETLEYYPLSKQCKIPCRIYSIQNK
jgi:hypothetical protein